MAHRKGEVMTVEEENDDGQIVANSKIAASIASSPTKEKANSGKSRQSESASPAPDSDTTTAINMTRSRKDDELRSKGKERENARDREQDGPRERDRSMGPRKTVTLQRPAGKSSKGAPPSHRRTMEPEYFGVSATSTVHRHRSQTTSSRPPSYHGPMSSHHPPSSNALYYMPPPPPPGSYMYPPGEYGGYAPNPLQHSPIIPPSPSDYPDPHGHFPAGQHLQPMNRPQSAMAYHRYPSSSSLPYDEYEQENDAPPARPRLTVRKPRLAPEVEDQMRMPPPPPPKRSLSARPRQLAIRPPPPPPPPLVTQRQKGYEDEIFEGDRGFYRDISPSEPELLTYGGYPNPMVPKQRRGSVSYDLQHYYEERDPREMRVSHSRPVPDRRRHSGFEPEGYNYEEKVRQASSYQEGLSGDYPLTKEVLRTVNKVNKRSQGSTRSTQSSDSRDESDWRNSATTRTTQSGPGRGDEDFTIKVCGQAVVEVQGTKIQCHDGQINILARRDGGGTRIDHGGARIAPGPGGERAAITYDDRRTRMERPLLRHARTHSQANSYRTPAYYPESYSRPYYEN